MTMMETLTPMDAADVMETLPAYDVREMIQTGSQARLILDGQTYLLRITRAGKLILTK